MQVCDPLLGIGQRGALLFECGEQRFALGLALLRCLAVRAAHVGSLKRLARSLPDREAPAFFLPCLARSCWGRRAPGAQGPAQPITCDAERSGAPLRSGRPGSHSDARRGGHGSAGVACEPAERGTAFTHVDDVDRAHAYHRLLADNAPSYGNLNDAAKHYARMLSFPLARRRRIQHLRRRAHRPTARARTPRRTTDADRAFLRRNPAHRKPRKARQLDLLFVRQYKTDEFGTEPYLLLGPARYVQHTGERPIAITWKLENRMPADFLRSIHRRSQLDRAKLNPDAPGGAMPGRCRGRCCEFGRPATAASVSATVDASRVDLSPSDFVRQE